MLLVIMGSLLDFLLFSTKSRIVIVIALAFGSISSFLLMLMVERFRLVVVGSIRYFAVMKSKQRYFCITHSVKILNLYLYATISIPILLSSLAFAAGRCSLCQLGHQQQTRGFD